VFDALINAFRAPDIRRRILFVFGMLIIVRALAHVPVPGVNHGALNTLFNNNQLLGLLNIFSGGGLSSFSVIGMGLNPYINASIILTLMQGVIPSLQALSHEGEYGRQRINQYTRYLTVPLALIQSYGFLAILNSQGVLTSFDLASLVTVTQIISLTAGTVLLMWLGELITERGIGNGVSFIIFAGIVGRVPVAVGAFLQAPDWAAGIALAVVGIIMIAAIIYMQEGQRRIPVQYASRVRGRRLYQGGATFLPLRVNQAGVIPIIFAVSIILFPAQLASYFASSQVAVVADVAHAIQTLLGTTSPLYAALYFALTVGFTYFYTAFTFKPEDTADQLRKNGGFIPGIRPGNPTRDYLQAVVFRITIAGALFLGVVAVMPFVISQAFPSLQGIALGGTALLIVVSVVVETMKQVEAQLMMRNYEGFIR
jgi:preprotein translocase subunit SecY